jgi:hypothetical protein
VHCLLDLSIEGRLFDYLGIICKAADIELAVTYLSASLTAADYEVTYIRITHSRFTYLKTLLASNLRSVIKMRGTEMWQACICIETMRILDILGCHHHILQQRQTLC